MDPPPTLSIAKYPPPVVSWKHEAYARRRRTVLPRDRLGTFPGPPRTHKGREGAIACDRRRVPPRGVRLLRRGGRGTLLLHPGARQGRDLLPEPHRAR